MHGETDEAIPCTFCRSQVTGEPTGFDPEDPDHLCPECDGEKFVEDEYF